MAKMESFEVQFVPRADFFEILGDCLSEQADLLLRKGVERPALNKKYNWGLRAFILRDFRDVLAATGDRFEARMNKEVGETNCIFCDKKLLPEKHPGFVCICDKCLNHAEKSEARTTELVCRLRDALISEQRDKESKVD